MILPFLEKLANLIQHFGARVFSNERTEESDDLPKLLNVNPLFPFYVLCVRVRACACQTAKQASEWREGQLVPTVRKKLLQTEIVGCSRSEVSVVYASWHPDSNKFVERLCEGIPLDVVLQGNGASHEVCQDRGSGKLDTLRAKLSLQKRRACLSAIAICIRIRSSFAPILSNEGRWIYDGQCHSVLLVGRDGKRKHAFVLSTCQHCSMSFLSSGRQLVGILGLSPFLQIWNASPSAVTALRLPGARHKTLSLMKEATPFLCRVKRTEGQRRELRRSKAAT